MNLFAPFIVLGKNILAGTRAALFLRIHLWFFQGGYLQICLLVAVSLGLTLLHDYYDTAPDNYFNPYGLGYQALLYLLFFFSLSLIAVINSRLRDLAKFIVLLLSIVPAVWLGTLCLSALAKQQDYIEPFYTSWGVFITYSLWYLIIVGRLIKRFFYLQILPATGFVLLYAAINFTPLFLLPTEKLWYPIPAVDQEKDKLGRIDVETVYYTQNQLLQDQFNGLIAGKSGETDLFYIGFAGDADEGVFMNEVKSAQRIISDYFGVFGRSLLLINNRATVKTTPLANGHNLKKAINKTADLMNLDEDILLLFLASHGSEDHYLSANFNSFNLNDIDANMINTALNGAGVKWRVIIVSACYSGGFIDQLADPYTLLITAASYDRNSFGCGHDGQYTYFGEAYFEKGLKKTRSFIKAFELAHELIRRKEKERGFENSNPQISLGAEIEKKLTELEESLRVQGNNNWASTANN